MTSSITTMESFAHRQGNLKLYHSIPRLKKISHLPETLRFTQGIKDRLGVLGDTNTDARRLLAGQLNRLCFPLVDLFNINLAWG